jgi:RNA polymerase sigma-70 factor (ECF subfamily)
MASLVTTLEEPLASEPLETRIRRVVDLYYDQVWRSLRRLGVPEGVADDAAQQVFCVFSARSADVALDKEKSFLFGVALRIAQTERRSRARRREVNDEQMLGAFVSEAPSPERNLHDREARALLDALLERMPFDLREVFVLYEIEELTLVEIAKISEVPLGTATSRLRRARQLFEQLAASVRGDER